MRYAVLHHTGQPEPDHFDLLIEREEGQGDLATWRLPEWPVLSAAEGRSLRDHRRHYLTYQGAIGGNRGTVVRIDEGDALMTTAHGTTRITFASGRALELTFQQDDLWIVRPG